MDIVKKNMWSIVCGVVAVLAVASTFYPLSGKIDELKNKLQASADQQQKFKGLINTNPNMPVIDPKTSEVKPLGMFPTEKVIEKGRQVVGKVHAESEKLQKAAMEMNKREPLVANALLVQHEPWMSAFKQQYYDAMDQLRKQMDATTIPTEQEVKDRVAQEWKDNFEPMIRKVGDVAQNEEQVKKEFEDIEKEIPRRMRWERSMQHVMYINPDKAGQVQGTTTGLTTSFDYHPGIPSLDRGDLPTVLDVWQAQLGYWIQEDVVKAIVESNKGAKTVQDAIVKRLLRTSIPKQYMTKAGPLLISNAANSGNFAGPANQPGQPEESTTTGPPKVFSVSATGRVCNPSYDVMHFTIMVDVDAQRFGTFVNNLTRDKFITILRMNIAGIDRERMQQTYFYYYGKQPVVRLEIKCEAIFFRSWTVDKDHPLMPVNVQKMLRISQTPGGVADAR